MTAASCVLLLPIGDQSEQALRNLRLVLGEALKAAFDKVLLVEQLPPGEESGCRKLVAEAGEQHPELELLSVAARGAGFERAHCINQAVATLEVERVWIHDPNLWLPFTELLTRMAEERASLIKPFGWFQRLNSQETALFLGGQTPPVAGSERRQGSATGKSSYVVDRRFFLTLRGLHEGFRGESDEGFELVRRMRTWLRDEVCLDDVVGRYLHRKLTDAQRRLREDSVALRKCLYRQLDADPEAYMQSKMESSLPADLSALRWTVAEKRRERAFHVDNLSEPKQLPTQLPGQLWGLTTFFNPAGYGNKKQNYDRFREALAQSGTPLCTVELSFGDRPFELSSDDADVLIQVRGGDVLWQKERLLNIGLEQLPGQCDKVAWLDCDILFENADWAEQTARALERYAIVQPFSRCARLRPGERRIDIGDLPLGPSEHEVLHSMAWGVRAHGRNSLTRFLEHGHCGYAWAGRRELLGRHGFYDSNVLGNADLNMAHAMFGGPEYLKHERLSAKAQAHLGRWASRFFADVQGSVGHVPGTVFHLWHGEKEARRYHHRLTILVEEDFDPEADLQFEQAGALRWASDKPNLHRFCQEYFAGRAEEDTGPAQPSAPYGSQRLDGSRAPYPREAR